MARLYLELNDCALRALLEGEASAPQPGCVRRTDKGLVFGAAAAAGARAEPSRSSDRFWDTLAQDALPAETIWNETPAQLVHAQLATIWADYQDKADEVLLIVPGSFSPRQLGLLLGICRQLEMPVAGLVDGAIAAQPQTGPAPQRLYLDLTQHRAIATRCQGQDRLVRTAVAQIDTLGLRHFMARVASAVSDLCVHDFRYDPMHSATAEQFLFDGLPAMLRVLADAESASLAVTTFQGEQEISVLRGLVEDACADLRQQLLALLDKVVDAQGGAVHVLLSERFAILPGVTEHLRQARDWAVSQAQDAAALHGVAEQPEQFLQPADAVGLALERNVRYSDQSDQVEQGTVPSHALVNGRLFALNGSAFTLGSDVEAGAWGMRLAGNYKGISRRHCELQAIDGSVLLRDLSRYGTYVNGHKVVRAQSVFAGDVIRIGNPGVDVHLFAARQASGETGRTQ